MRRPSPIYRYIEYGLLLAIGAVSVGLAPTILKHDPTIANGILGLSFLLLVFLFYLALSDPKSLMIRHSTSMPELLKNLRIIIPFGALFPMVGFWALYYVIAVIWQVIFGH